MKKGFIYSCLIILVLFSVSLAQDLSNKKTTGNLDEYLSRMSAFGFSGAVIVEKDDQIILRKGYGFANKEKKTPFTTDTPFPVQSISKQFTAASILKLEGQGKLNLEDPITKFIKNVPTDKKEITIHQLLTNTSGVGNNYAGSKIYNREEAVKTILDQPLNNPIGEKMEYSSDGYELLAAIVEIISKQTLSEFIRQNFFIPAGMKTAGFQGEGNFWKEKEVAHAYNSYVDNGSPQFDKPDWDGYGSGDIVVSANDLYKWELSLRENKILSAKLKEKMFTPYSFFMKDWQYGYGWFVIKSDRGTTEYYHGGGDTPRGYTASYTRYPVEKMTIIIFTNTMIDELGFLGAIKDNITKITLGKAIKMPPDFIKSTPSQFEKLEGFYKAVSGEKFVVQYKDDQLMVGALNQEAIDFLTTPDKETKENLKKYSKLTTQFVERITQDKSGTLPLQSEFSELEQQYGKLQNYKLLGTYPVSESRKLSTTYVKLNFKDGSETVRFVRRGDNTPYPLVGNPFPALTPIMMQKENNFVAYYPFLQKKITLRFGIKNDEIKMLWLKSGNQTLSANKL